MLLTYVQQHRSWKKENSPIALQISGSHIYDYDEQIRRYVRVPNKKIFILETGEVLGTNEKGAYITGSGV